MLVPEYAQNDVTAKYIPSPEDIIRATKEIQKSWSRREERKRRGGIETVFEFQVIKSPKYSKTRVTDI